MKTRICVLAVSFLAVACVAWAGDWTYWRGPELNGVSRETGLVEDWSLEDKKNVLWVSPIGGRATPVVLNGRIYLNARTMDDVNDPVEKVHAREQVVCRDANTGEVIWKDVFNVFQTDIAAPRVGWAAMTGDSETGFVYVHCVSGLFRCYDQDGNVIWEHSLFEDFGKISGYGGRTQTPIIDENRIIVAFLARNWGETKGPPPKHTFYAFDKHTGALLWTSAPAGKPQDTTYSNPTIAVINGQRLLICGCADGAVHAINARTGEPVWQFRMSQRGLNSSPVVDGNLVYIAHGEDNIDTTTFGRVQCIDGTGAGDITDSHSVWRVDEVKSGYTGMLVKDGILYVVTDTGNLDALDSKTGDKLWSHDLGQVGKGSPVWADGKIYVMEVNGHIHILKPSREGCESLSEVALKDGSGRGYDEIYASPAIANGRVYLVSRDRTICLGNEDQKATTTELPSLPEEAAVGEVAKIQLVPFETFVSGGGTIKYELHAFDKNGRLVEKMVPKLESQADLPDVKVDGDKLVFGEGAATQAGHVVAKLGDLTATARVRQFSKLPWTFDFNDGKTPAEWVNGIKLPPGQVDGEASLHFKSVGIGRPSNYVWLGPSTMKGYTIQADVRMTEQRRRLPSVGVTANRYNFIIKGNNGKLAIQSWPAHLRMAKEIRFRSDPDIWYTMKMRIDIKEDGAHIRGKVWKRDEDEPEEWTLETVDPHANENGSPGLYTYALAESYFDNVIVTSE